MTIEIVITLESGKRITLTHSEIAELRRALYLEERINGEMSETVECPTFDISNIPTFSSNNGN